MSATTDTRAVPGPVLILGAGGFIGSACLHRFLSVRDDVLGVYHRDDARVADVSRKHVMSAERLEEKWDELWAAGGFRTVFDFAAAGAAGAEDDPEKLYEANLLRVARLTAKLRGRRDVRYLLAGSSSEYGFSSDRAPEDARPTPNSLYAASKAAATLLLEHLGREEGFPCATLRLFSVYGPGEAPGRLMPTLVRAAAREKRWPPLVDRDVAHDFIEIDDVLSAFEKVATGLKPEHHGITLNVGSGRQTTMGELCARVAELFRPEGEPAFGTYPRRRWDQTAWAADIRRISREFGWSPLVSLDEGLRRLAAESGISPAASAVRPVVSVVAALYRDARGLPELVDETADAFERAGVRGELILVNDASPDETEELIRDLSRTRPWIVGITHSRNFGSQSAFLSGLEVATGDAAILMDGDLQDPPAVIPDLVREWRKGASIVLARRKRREMARWRESLYRACYRLWNLASDHPIPADVGDFSLMDRRAVNELLAMKTSEPVLRADRAFLGFPTASVDYVRPERRYGVSNHSWFSLFRWVARSLSLTAGRLFDFVILLETAGLVAWTAFTPWSARSWPSTLLTAVVLLGQILMQTFLLRVWRQSSPRPPFVRRHRIERGEVRPWKA